MYAASERTASHWQGDAEEKSQQLREAEECNRGLSEQLAQAEQNAAVFQAQVAELKEDIRRKDEQVVAGEVAAAKVASLEAEVEKLT